MRPWILDTTRDLLSTRESAPHNAAITLDEIAACAGISLSQLHAYYTSIAAIEADLVAHESTSTRSDRANVSRS